MTNTQRNTLVLTALLILAFFGGGWLLRTIGQKKIDTDQKITIVANQIASIEQQLSQIGDLKRQLEIHKQLIAHQSKIIFLEDTPTITYRYLLKMMAWMKRNVIFDFALKSSGTDANLWNQYVINGRASYTNLLPLVQSIEYQRALLTLDELSIAADNVADSDTVSFSAVFRTHYSPTGIDPEMVKPKSYSPTPLRYQPFRIRVYDVIPPREIDPDLLRIESSVLIGLSPSRIFVRDERGIIRILSVGDPVALGYLDRIDLVGETAVFKINYYGLYEDKTLTLKKN
ncbi:MAG: hypothetical protein FJ042_07360 [Candidatus Cloacimonetes bacterium]|nr:hypothetical protein [Candidatus Cloacimonadota bacterium]